MESFRVITGNDPHINIQILPALDPRISYSSYVAMDRLIDVDRLISPDRYLTEGIEKHAADSRDPLLFNQLRRKQASPYEPGVTDIRLKRTIPGTLNDHPDLDPDSLWDFTQAAVGLAYSLRADGHLADEFRAQIPKPEYNAASTPALSGTFAREKVHIGGSR